MDHPNQRKQIHMNPPIQNDPSKQLPPNHVPCYTLTPEQEKIYGILPKKPTVAPRPLAEILADIEAFLRRYIVFPFKEQSAVIALWIVHTHLFEAFDYTPYLFVYSASKRSGKSHVLDCLKLLSRNAMKVSGASAAALIRSVDEAAPMSMMLDEVDCMFPKGKGDSESTNLRGFLDAGYERGAIFIRCGSKSENFKPEQLPAFCPKAFAGIGHCIPDTVLDRSIPIEMLRQTRGEKVERMRARDAKALAEPIRLELESLSQRPGLIEILQVARPKVPEALNDRAMDFGEPLLAIADHIGKEWPEVARNALIKLCSEEEDADLGVKLLADIKGIFDKEGQDKLPTLEILKGLVAIEDDRPWARWWAAELNSGNVAPPANSLAKMLKGYRTPSGEKIKASRIRMADHSQLRGYLKTDFLDAWERHDLIPSSLSLNPVLPVTPVSSPDFSYEENKTGPNEQDVSAFEPVLPFYPAETVNQDSKTIKTASEGINEKMLFPGDFLWFESTEDFKRFWGPDQLIPTTCVGLSNSPAKVELEAVLGDSLSCGQKLEDGFYYHRTRHAARCKNCKETEWIAQDFEVVNGFPYGDWNATQEVRSAEVMRNAMQETQRYALANGAPGYENYNAEIDRLDAIIGDRERGPDGIRVRKEKAYVEI
jgi:Protein of unknown function (DUF3631)